MISINRFFYIVISLILFLISNLVHAEQTETKVSCNEFNEPLSINYGNHTMDCVIDTLTDLDQFDFDGAVGEQIRMTIRSESGGLDPRLEVRDPDGTVIEDKFCNGGSGGLCALESNLSLTLRGTYLIAVSDTNSDESGGYILQLERFPPTTTPLLIPINSSINGSINPVTDTDFLNFKGNTNTDVRITIRSQSGGFDPRLEVRDPDGIVIEDKFCNGGSGGLCSIESNLSLTLGGAYLISVSDTNSDEEGNFELNIQCLFGDCPDTMPHFSFETSQLSLPLVRVPSVGDFSANLELSTDPSIANEFILSDAALVSGTFESSTTFEDGLLRIQSVEVILLGGGIQYYQVDMRLIPATTPLRFQLLRTTLIQ